MSSLDKKNIAKNIEASGNVHVGDETNITYNILNVLSELSREKGGSLPEERAAEIIYSYADDYQKPLFLHNDNPKVSLKNLFVVQKYREIMPNHVEEEIDHDDLWERLGRFTRTSENRMLLIEGDAGCGKTSLVQALCWHAREKDATYRTVMDERPLLLVRLRDIERNRITVMEGMLPSIMDYLKIDKDLTPTERKKQLLLKFPQAVLVLDGFDELCIIEGIHDYENLLHQLARELTQCSISDKWHIIVTSRPNYIKGDFNVFYPVLELRHFDRAKREAWLKQYTAEDKCCQKIEQKLADYILQSEEEGVCDTPFTLYLLATGNVDTSDQTNQWKLYRNLFGKIAEKPYEEYHPGLVYKEPAYRLAAEIAFRMYKSGNKQLYLCDSEVNELVSALMQDPKIKEKVRDNETAKDLSKRNTALCCYWKVQSERGAVEFYHNNIRDFFLGEKIYESIEAIYNDSALKKEEKVEKLIEFLCEYQEMPLEPRVVQFLYNRALYYSSNHIKHTNGYVDFPSLEESLRLLPVVLQRFLTDGSIFSKLNKEQPLPAITNVLRCLVQITYAVLLPLYNKNGYLRMWWTDIDEVNKAGLLRRLFRDMFEETDRQKIWTRYGTRGDFQGVSLVRSDLRKMDLQGSIFVGADLSEASLVEADLRDTNLGQAILHKADLRTAILCNANLLGVDWREANLQYADFRWALLPDNFRSEKPDEIAAYFRKLDIEKLWYSLPEDNRRQ